MRHLSTILNFTGSGASWALLVAIGDRVVRHQGFDAMGRAWFLAALVAVGMIIITYLHRFLAWSGKGVPLAGVVTTGLGGGALALFYFRVDAAVVAYLVAGVALELVLSIDAALLKRRAVRAEIPKFDRVPPSRVIFASIPFVAGSLGACLGYPKIGVVYVVWMVVASVFGFRLIIVDKLRAAEGSDGSRMRVPENTLHTIELIGGWPGSVLAQYGVRHKTSKRSYRMKFMAMVTIHVIAVAAIAVAVARWA